jgi:hypothetical protein
VKKKNNQYFDFPHVKLDEILILSEIKIAILREYAVSASEVTTKK